MSDAGFRSGKGRPTPEGARADVHGAERVPNVRQAPEAAARVPRETVRRLPRPKPFYKTWWALAAALVALGAVTWVAAGNRGPATAEPPASGSVVPVASAPATATIATATVTTATALPVEGTQTPVAAPGKKTYKPLTSTEFEQLAKKPTAVVGRTCVIYGWITQFDDITGPERFRANTGPRKLTVSNGQVNYTQTSMLRGDKSTLAKLVQGDCFAAKVTVLGSYPYDTQVGGNTTVPLFMVESISTY
jgi:hypothetical protein